MNKLELSERKLLEDLIAMFLLKNTLSNRQEIKQTALSIIDVYAKGYDWNTIYTQAVKNHLIEKFVELQ